MIKAQDNEKSLMKLSATSTESLRTLNCLLNILCNMNIMCKSVKLHYRKQNVKFTRRVMFPLLTILIK